jgi:hypothetical protein
VTSAGPGQAQYEIRGLSASGGESPTIGFYLGETPIAPPATAGFAYGGDTPVLNAASASANGVNPMVNLSWTPDGGPLLYATAAKQRLVALGCGLSFTANGPNASVKGGEAELQAKLTQGLRAREPESPDLHGSRLQLRGHQSTFDRGPRARGEILAPPDIPSAPESASWIWIISTFARKSLPRRSAFMNRFSG